MRWSETDIEKLKLLDNKYLTTVEIEKLFNRNILKIYKKAREINIKFFINNKNINDFLDKVKNNKLDVLYDYSESNYKNNRTKIKIKCKKHNIFFYQTPLSHLQGYLSCPSCTKNKKLDFNTFIVKSNIKHNNFYDYSLVKFKNNKDYINIICPIHGIFKQRVDMHLQGQKCDKCDKEYANKFIKKSIKIHNNYYDYSISNYIDTKTKIDIICPIHGKFKQTPNSHLKGHGCFICNKSKGEILISTILDNNNIKYIQQKTFDSCINKRRLPFDFYLPEYNICIEFDGRQHYEIIEYWGGLEKFNYTIKNDMIKTNFCLKNNITLIRINYKLKYDQIFNLLKNNRIL